MDTLKQAWNKVNSAILSVPVRIKITGIIVLAVLILGATLYFWVQAGLSDWLSYLLSETRIDAAMGAGGRGIVYVTLIGAAGALVAGILLTLYLVRPLIELRDMALKVAAGELDARAPVYSKDEIGEVAMAVNSMTDHLVQMQRDMTRTNRRLSAVNQVMLAAEQQVEIHDVLFAILQNIIEVMNLQTGWVYLRDPDRDTFHLASWYQVPSWLEEPLLNQEPDHVCACQQELVDGTLPEAVAMRECYRLASCASHGLPQDHITIPIEARGQQYGIVNLLCPRQHELQAEDFDLLGAIGGQISEIVANAWLRLKLEEKEVARQALLESLVEAQEEERRRLARELHDGAGQMLTGLLVRIKTLEKRNGDAEMNRSLADLQRLVSTTIEQVRELSHRLRPAALEEFGLPVALQVLMREMTVDTAIQRHCRLDLERERVPPGVDVILYRIAQEALTNALRHAQAGDIGLALFAEEATIVMIVEDNGRGFSPFKPAGRPGERHLGLIDMRERAAIAGGKLDVFTAPGKGTRIVVRVPARQVQATDTEGAGG